MPSVFRVFLCLLIAFWFQLVSAAGASAQQVNVNVICSNGSQQRTFQIGFDNSNQFFDGRGYVPRLYCEGGYAGSWDTYVSDNLTNTSLGYYQGISPVPIQPQPEPSQTQTPSPEPSPSPESQTATDTPSPSPSPVETPTASATPEPEPEPSQTPSPSPSETETVPVSPPVDPAPSPSESATASTEPPATPPQTIEPPAQTPQQPPVVEPVPIVPPEPVVVPEPEPIPESVPEPAQEPVPEPAPVAEPSPEPEPQPEPELIPAPIEVDNEPTQEVASVDNVNLASLAPDTPVQLANGVILTAEVVMALQTLENPAALLGALFSDPAQVLLAFASVGADMTPKDREESQKAVVAAVIASGLAAQIRKP